MNIGLLCRDGMVLVIEDQSEILHLVSAINAQRAQIQELLIRQTLIEEMERRHRG